MARQTQKGAEISRDGPKNVCFAESGWFAREVHKVRCATKVTKNSYGQAVIVCHGFTNVPSPLVLLRPPFNLQTVTNSPFWVCFEVLCSLPREVLPVLPSG